VHASLFVRKVKLMPSVFLAHAYFYALYSSIQHFAASVFQ